MQFHLLISDFEDMFSFGNFFTDVHPLLYAMERKERDE
jgi:hypothetical protein